jgi:hypothetical protein
MLHQPAATFKEPASEALPAGLAILAGKRIQAEVTSPTLRSQPDVEAADPDCVPWSHPRRRQHQAGDAGFERPAGLIDCASL